MLLVPGSCVAASYANKNVKPLRPPLSVPWKDLNEGILYRSQTDREGNYEISKKIILVRVFEVLALNLKTSLFKNQHTSC